jgi:hypothetical protein
LIPTRALPKVKSNKIRLPTMRSIGRPFRLTRLPGNAGHGEILTYMIIWADLFIHAPGKGRRQLFGQEVFAAALRQLALTAEGDILNWCDTSRR